MISRQRYRSMWHICHGGKRRRRYSSLRQALRIWLRSSAYGSPSPWTVSWSNGKEREERITGHHMWFCFCKASTSNLKFIQGAHKQASMANCPYQVYPLWLIGNHASYSCMLSFSFIFSFKKHNTTMQWKTEKVETLPAANCLPFQIITGAIGQTRTEGC